MAQATTSMPRGDPVVVKGLQGIQHRYKLLKDEVEEYNKQYERDTVAIREMKIRRYNAIQQQKAIQQRMSDISDKMPKLVSKIKYCEERLFQAERRKLENQDFSYKLQTILKEDVLAAERELEETKDSKVGIAVKFRKALFKLDEMELKVQKAEKRRAKAEENVYVMEQRLQAVHRALNESKTVVFDNVNEILERKIEGLKMAIGRQRNRCMIAEDKVARLYSDLEEKDKELKYVRRRNTELQMSKRDLLSSKLF